MIFGLYSKESLSQWLCAAAALLGIGLGGIGCGDDIPVADVE